MCGENSVALQEKQSVPAQFTRVAQEAFDPAGAKWVMTGLGSALNVKYRLLRVSAA